MINFRFETAEFPQHSHLRLKLLNPCDYRRVGPQHPTKTKIIHQPASLEELASSLHVSSISRNVLIEVRDEKEVFDSFMTSKFDFLVFLEEAKLWSALQPLE